MGHSPAGQLMRAVPEPSSTPLELGSGPRNCAGGEMGGGGPQNMRVTHQLWLVWSVLQCQKSSGVEGRAQHWGWGFAGMAWAWGRATGDRTWAGVQLFWQAATFVFCSATHPS